MNAYGGGERQLTPYDDDVISVWSPDGTEIAFERKTVYLMASDGGAQHSISELEGAPNDWQPLPGPRRSEFRNAAHFCKSERTFMGESAFGSRYGDSVRSANAFGKCVSANGG
jgi:Tol biopolymer transport system component